MGPGLADELAGIVRMQDEPVADPAAVPTFYVCRLAARSVKVVLTGEGGDELLGGYPRYAWLRRGEQLRGRPGVAAAAASCAGCPGRARGAGRSPARRARRARAPGGPAPDLGGDAQRRRPAALTGARLGAARARLARLLAETGAADPVHALMALDFRTWLPDDVLVKTDRMSMAASIEARVPLLDHRLVEFAAGLPASLKVRTLGTKGLLRRALAPDLPAATLARPKRAFLVPLGAWLGGELRELLHDTLGSAAARTRGLLRPEAVTRLLEEQAAGHDHGRALWTLLIWSSGCGTCWMRLLLLTIDFPPARGGVQGLLAAWPTVWPHGGGHGGDRGRGRRRAPGTARGVHRGPRPAGGARVARPGPVCSSARSWRSCAAAGRRGVRPRPARARLSPRARAAGRAVRRLRVRVRDPGAAHGARLARLALGGARRVIALSDFGRRAVEAHGVRARARGRDPAGRAVLDAVATRPCAGAGRARRAVGGPARRRLQGPRHGHPGDAADPGPRPAARYVVVGGGPPPRISSASPPRWASAEGPLRRGDRPTTRWTAGTGAANLLARRREPR